MAIVWAVLALSYLGALFYLARWGESGSARAKALAQHPISYSLALAIYCTAWTYFGAVGESARSGWSYLPILMGPMLVYLLGYGFLKKMARVVQHQHITTISDFIASRYGKRQRVALFVTVIALLATIPYIALQLKAIGAGFNFISGNQSGQDNAQSVVLAATVVIALIAGLFGSNKADVTEVRSGLTMVIAFESLLKLLALLVLAIVAVSMLDWKTEALVESAAIYDWSVSHFFSLNFLVQTLMAAAAIICLPRQFHIAFVGNNNLDNLKRARWIFPGYLLLLAVLIPFIAIAGNILIGNPHNADIYVLQLAKNSDITLLQILVFLGGLSAATGMVMVAALTLSTMMTNDVVLPMLLARNAKKMKRSGYFEQRILLIRRSVIAGILFLAFLYQQQMANASSLASIGLLAFSLVIQLLPAIVGGLYWKRGHAQGVCAGLVGGLISWVLWLLLQAGGSDASNFMFTDSLISQGAIFSLLVNGVLYVLFSLLAQPNLIDRMQAQLFVVPREELTDQTAPAKVRIRVGDLTQLLSTFLGAERASSLIDDFTLKSPSELTDSHEPSAEFIEFCERALGGVIGASSARAMMRAALYRQPLNFEEVASFFDDTTQAIQFNQDILFTTLENLQQGICVVDKDLKLVVWNRGYQELFDYPDDLLFVGQLIEKLIYFNVENGECGPGQIDELVHKRLEYLKRASAHKFLRRRANGRVIEMIGKPISGGGFLTSFNDITDHVEAQHALQEANIDLTKRVDARSAEIKSINDELHQEVSKRTEAEREAFAANASKTRFLAQASHDILQPMNAARLYLAALQETELSQSSAHLAEKVSQSVASADGLIATLLEIARLDQGGMQPKLETFRIDELCQPLVDEYRIMARDKGLKLRYYVTAKNLWVHSDRIYCRRILQNLLSNAVKYTHSGRVLLAIRPQGRQLKLQIMDTGRGIEAAQSDRVFDDFYRIEGTQQSGVGLGLAVVARMAKSLNLNVALKSTVNRGSSFSFLLNCDQAPADKVLAAGVVRELNATKRQINVLCIDDIQENLDAMQALLECWNCKVALAVDEPQAKELCRQERPDLILADYQLSAHSNGIDAIAALREEFGGDIPAALITANSEDELAMRCQAGGIFYHPKPVKPAKLRALVNSIGQAALKI